MAEFMLESKVQLEHMAEEIDLADWDALFVDSTETDSLGKIVLRYEDEVVEKVLEALKEHGKTPETAILKLLGV
jgi:hydrogenase maturation factor